MRHSPSFLLLLLQFWPRHLLPVSVNLTPLGTSCEWGHTEPVLPRLVASLSTVSCRFLHPVAGVRRSSFWRLSNIPRCELQWCTPFVWGFPHDQSNSVTAARAPQLNSILTPPAQTQHQTPQVKGSVLQDGPTSDTSLKSQLSPVHSTDQL